MEEQDSVSALKERKLKVLSRKNEERKIELEKRKGLKLNQAVDEENINTILEKFEKLEENILSGLKQIEDENVPKESLPELFDSCYCKLEEWQNMISLSSHVLKIYHKKHLQNKYLELNDRRAKLHKTLIPEKKFSFKKVQKKTAENEVSDEVTQKLAEDTADAVVKKVSKKPWFKAEDEFGFFNKEGEELFLTHDEVFKKDVVFRNMKNCKLDVRGGATTIHFVALSDCRVLCGPVSTSVFVENCQNCTFVVACQQLRIHSTYDTDFYLHVTSRAIVEDCQRVRFAPYNWKYQDIETHFKAVDLDIDQNNWNLVNDFNWLSAAPSPNWSVINEADRVVQWN